MFTIIYFNNGRTSQEKFFKSKIEGTVARKSFNVKERHVLVIRIKGRKSQYLCVDKYLFDMIETGTLFIKIENSSDCIYDNVVYKNCFC
ncbi:hypothetical protein BH09BAC1_BH09BAC1_28480 [soil metagenome]